MAILTIKTISSRIKRLKNNFQTIIDQCDLSINDIVVSNLLTTNESIHSNTDISSNSSNLKTAERQKTEAYSVYKSLVEDFSYEKISDLCSVFFDSISFWNAINFRFENKAEFKFQT